MKSSRILFLSLNARYSQSNPALLYLRKHVEDLDYTTAVLELTASEKETVIAERIKSYNPLVLAVSVYIWNTLKVRKLLEFIKDDFPELKVVLGGPEVSCNSSDWIRKFDKISYIISGPGEESFRKLAASGFSENSSVIEGLNPHFSIIKFPYNSDDMKRLSGRYIYYESSRGCPFKCTYCLSSERGNNVEFRHIDQVREELDFFSVYEPSFIKFVDRTFNINRNHFRPVWEYIVEKFTGKRTRFHFEIFPELLNGDDLDYLSKVPSGLFQFEMGIQSTQQDTLHEIKRPGSWEKAAETVSKLVNMGNIHLHTDLIAGLPFENYSGFRQSFNRVYSLGADYFQAGFLKVLPGTEMFRKSEEYGLEYNSIPPYEVSVNRWLSRRELEKLKFIGELVELVYNSGHFIETGKFMVSLYGSAFDFYDRAAGFFHKNENALHRKWDYLAGLFSEMMSADYPENLSILKDCLRWDWCSSMKDHHYPAILKTDLTFYAKREGYRFFIEKSVNKIINYSGFSFTLYDLRKSIFFIAESAAFSEIKMKDKMALFLPDKRIIYFNPDLSG